MAKYIIPVNDFKNFLDENKTSIAYDTFTKLTMFIDGYFVNDENDVNDENVMKYEKPKTNKLVQDAKKYFKTFMDSDYVDSWMQHNEVFLEKLDEIAYKKKPSNLLQEIEPIFKDIRENSKSFVEKYTKKNTGSKNTHKREFKCSDMISENGNKIVHWTLIDNDNNYEGFGSKGVAIAKKLQADGILKSSEIAYIKNIHNYCKAYGKNN